MPGRFVKVPKSDKYVIWFSRILRWGLGAGFLLFGIKTIEQGGWAACLIGIVLVITGFLKPRRCLEESCARD